MFFVKSGRGKGISYFFSDIDQKTLLEGYENAKKIIGCGTDQSVKFLYPVRFLSRLMFIFLIQRTNLTSL